MKVIVAIGMGFLSGLMLYFLSGLVLIKTVGPGILITVAFIGGWAASTYLLLKGARSLSKVFSRGFLLGAAEWLCLIPASMIFAGSAVSDTVARAGGSDAAAAGAVIGGGLVTFLSGGLAVAMAVVCLIGFAISHSLGREMKPEAAAATRKCPECAELIQAEAKKCRFCGAALGATSSGPLADLDPHQNPTVR